MAQNPFSCFVTSPTSHIPFVQANLNFFFFSYTLCNLFMLFSSTIRTEENLRAFFSVSAFENDCCSMFIDFSSVLKKYYK